MERAEGFLSCWPQGRRNVSASRCPSPAVLPFPAVPSFSAFPEGSCPGGFRQWGYGHWSWIRLRCGSWWVSNILTGFNKSKVSPFPWARQGGRG
ncbi:hypothetical protein ElyMa_002987600 [Elysia marginata]|uniref:Uncharacterized protein n=1 Tax=Elysia marginata TaxID=1093978 RepID=A0AAV4IBW0_9GAST|nr:hypothetical protein ElyMa_002987600 [Elysia marginata]